MHMALPRRGVGLVWGFWTTAEKNSSAKFTGLEIVYSALGKAPPPDRGHPGPTVRMRYGTTIVTAPLTLSIEHPFLSPALHVQEEIA